MRRRLTVFASFCLVVAATSALAANADSTSNDPFRWMEIENGSLRAWILARSEAGRNFLGAFPGRKTLEYRVKQIGAAGSLTTGLVLQNGRRFFYRSTAEHPYLRLFVKEDNSADRLLIDPPKQYGLSYYSPSPDGQYVAYGLSRNGSEITSLRVLDVQTGQDLTASFPPVRWPSVSWERDSQSFFYTRLAADFQRRSESQRYSGRKVYLHHIGKDPVSDEALFAVGMHHVEGTQADAVSISTSRKSPWILGFVEPGISGASGSVYAARTDQLYGRQTRWKKVADRGEGFSEALLAGGNVYLARRNEKSGYTIIRRSLSRSRTPDQEILRWDDGGLTSFTMSSDSLYVVYFSAGQSKFVRVPLSGTDRVQDVPLPYAGTVDVVFADETQSDITFRIQSWLKSPLLFRYDHLSDSLAESGIIEPSTLDFSPYVAEEKLVRSRDGVLVPLTIIRRSDIAFDGSNLTWLTAYGAYGVSTFPYFDASRLAWLEKGGIIAIGHVRGGGELGPKWHEAGRQNLKMNSVNDFIDCAEYLVGQKYTRPDRLVASGASAGGIVLGMAVASRPDLFAAVSIDSGMLNAMRFGKLPIGPANFDEFGTTRTKEGVRFLRTIDAYQSLRPGVKYPAVLLTVGLNDSRVSPWQSAKFAARLMDINKSVTDPNPVLLVAQNAGHGPFTAKQATTNLADTLSFFLAQTIYKNAHDGQDSQDGTPRCNGGTSPSSDEKFYIPGTQCNPSSDERKKVKTWPD